MKSMSSAIVAVGGLLAFTTAQSFNDRDSYVIVAGIALIVSVLGMIGWIFTMIRDN